MTSVDASHDETPGDDQSPGEVTDEMVLAVIDELVDETGRRPGRDRLKKRLPDRAKAPGSSRLERLLREHTDRAGEASRATSPHLRPVPDRADDDDARPGEPTVADRAEASAYDRATGRADRADLPDSDRADSREDRAGEAVDQRADDPTGRAGRAGELDSDRADGPSDRSGPVASDRAASPDSDRAGKQIGNALARFISTGLEAGEAKIRDRASRPVEAGEPAPAHERGKAAQFIAWVRSAIIPTVLVVIFIGAGVTTWVGGVLLAQRLGWGPVAVAPGWAEGAKVDPTLFLPLCVELVLAVAVHRIAVARPGVPRFIAIGLSVVAVAIAVTVQRYAHADTLPGWLGPFIGVVPVIALAMTVALSNIPTRRD